MRADTNPLPKCLIGCSTQKNFFRVSYIVPIFSFHCSILFQIFVFVLFLFVVLAKSSFADVFFLLLGTHAATPIPSI